MSGKLSELKLWTQAFNRIIKFTFLLFLYCIPSNSFCADKTFDTSGILKTVEEEILSIRQGDLFHAYSTLTTQTFKENTCFDDFLVFISKIPSLYNNAYFSLGFAKVEDQNAIYEGEICASEGEKMAIHIDLKKGKTKWLIESMIVYPLSTKEMTKHINNRPTVKERFSKFFGFSS